MKDDRRYFHLVRHYEGVRVSVKFDGDAPLSDVLDSFEAFLKACGYTYEGALDFVGTINPEREE